MKAPWTCVMNGASDELLAGTAFAGDEHGGVSRADGLDGFEDANHSRALADEFVRTRNFVNLFAQALIFLLSAAMRQGILHEVRDLVRIERLGDVIVCAILE